ncbi:MAG: hypothetical protein ACT4PP_01760 [Sporichthyaceae bacterium]
MNNDIHAIYEIASTIAATQAEHSIRFDGLDTKLDQVIDLIRDRT